MAVRTRVSIVHQRALNQTLMYIARAPQQALFPPLVYLRAMRSALRMPQRVLAKRSGVPQANIARIEAGEIDPQLGTLLKLYDAMLCDVVILPKPRRRPGDVLADWYIAHSGKDAWQERRIIRL